MDHARCSSLRRSNVSAATRHAALARVFEMASEGMRVLAIAEKLMPTSRNSLDDEDVVEDFV